MSSFRPSLRVLAPVLAALALWTPSLLRASEPTGPLTAEPTVPRPSTKPCVVPLFTDTELVTGDDVLFDAPSDCPPPWSKIVLEGDLTSVLRSNSVANFRVELFDPNADTRWVLFMGAPQINAGAASWRVERDLTDDAALFRRKGELHVQLDYDWDNTNPTPELSQDSVHGNVRLLFYPQSASEPAPRVPDGVYAQDAPQSLPRNIVKAYVEVLAQGLDEADVDGSSDRFWFACFPTPAYAAYAGLRSPFGLGDQWGASLSSTLLGCNGGSFREVEVWLDGDTFLGIAPLYPWLPSNLHRTFHDTLDAPVPSAHALTFVPYRLDVTPFASKLDNGLPHRLTVRVVGDTGPVPVHARTEAKLFVFLDPRLSVVTGALTRNTLSHARPAVTSTLAGTADAVSGTVDTQASRKMDVEGFVNTSAGRVHSAVHTEVDFQQQSSINVDEIIVLGEHRKRYAILAGLESRVLQSSARVLGGSVLERDATVVHYPLRLAYGMTGVLEDISGDGDLVALPRFAQVVVDQTRSQVTEQWRGAAHYQTALRDHFAGQRQNVFHFGMPERDIDWSSRRDYAFLDTRAGCYTAARLTSFGVLTGSATGAGCPGGVNSNAWYTRPDGSPDNMGWAP